MPRSKTNLGTSNLSVILLRDIHRRAKVNYLRTGVDVSFGAYIAWCLQQAPERLDHSEKMDLRMIEMQLQCLMPRKR